MAIAMAISRKRRRAILAAHGGACHYCGGFAGTVDHIVAPSSGGTDDLGNLIPACLACNSAKCNRCLPRDREQQALGTAEAMRQTVLQIEGVPERREKLDQRIPIMMTETMKAQIDAWRRPRGIDDRSEAIRLMIEEKLQAEQTVAA
jgi:hypothetical protein